MKGKEEGKEIWGHHRHDRSTQICLLGSWHCHTTFCSHCSKSPLFAHRVGEKAACLFLLHCKSSGSTLNVKATYFRSSIGKRKFFRGFSKHLEKIMNVHLHIHIPLKKSQQSKHNLTINLQICRFNPPSPQIWKSYFSYCVFFFFNSRQHFNSHLLFSLNR